MNLNCYPLQLLGKPFLVKPVTSRCQSLRRALLHSGHLSLGLLPLKDSLFTCQSSVWRPTTCVSQESHQTQIRNPVRQATIPLEYTPTAVPMAKIWLLIVHQVKSQTQQGCSRNPLGMTLESLRDCQRLVFTHPHPAPQAKKP